MVLLAAITEDMTALFTQQARRSKTWLLFLQLSSLSLENSALQAIEGDGARCARERKDARLVCADDRLCLGSLRFARGARHSPLYSQRHDCSLRSWKTGLSTLSSQESVHHAREGEVTRCTREGESLRSRSGSGCSLHSRRRDCSLCSRRRESSLTLRERMLATLAKKRLLALLAAGNSLRSRSGSGCSLRSRSN